MPARNRAPRIPSDLGVVVGVQIDEAGRDNQSISIDDPFGETLRPTPELRDLAVFDPDVAAVARDPGAVDDGAAFDLNVELCHSSSSYPVRTA